MKITVHEARKSEDFSYPRVSTPVAQAYRLLDDQYCDENGKITGPALDSVMVFAENDEPIYNYAMDKRVKSHSVAWMALLKDIAFTLKWYDDTPHATSLSSEQVKNWFKLKGQDYKEELAPFVKLVDEWRTDMFKGESKQDESIVTTLTGAIQKNKPEVLLSDDAVTYFDDYDDMLDEFETAYQTYVHVSGNPDEDILFLYKPDDNIVAIGDFDVDHEVRDRAKELMEKFVRGELVKADKPLGGLDYVVIEDGNTYTATAFVERE